MTDTVIVVDTYERVQTVRICPVAKRWPSGAFLTGTASTLFSPEGIGRGALNRRAYPDTPENRLKYQAEEDRLVTIDVQSD